MSGTKEDPWIKIAREATQRGLWIYEPNYKRWYTPEDFLHVFGHVKSYDAELYKKMQIRNPIEGINAGFKQIDDVYARLKVFSERVAKYYQEDSQKKTKNN
jgi:hypothetical protein